MIKKLLYFVSIVTTVLITMGVLNLLEPKFDGARAITQMERYAMAVEGVVAGILIKDIFDASLVPAAYTDGGAERLDGTKKKSHIGIVNDSDGTIQVCMKGAGVAASCEEDLYLPAGGTLALDDIAIADKVFIRRPGGALVGTIWVGAW